MAKQIPVRQLRMLASRIHTLPSQEQERVRKIFRQERPEVFMKGLLAVSRTSFALPVKARECIFALPFTLTGRRANPTKLTT